MVADGFQFFHLIIEENRFMSPVFRGFISFVRVEREETSVALILHE